MTAGADETLDLLRNHDLRVIQKRDGYRFSLDPLLLADFVSLQRVRRVIDLGTGCGVIPLILVRRSPDLTAVGVEMQEVMAELAERNVRLNGLDPRVSVVHEDVLHIRRHFPVSSFDLVTANPPYRVRRSGRTSPRAGRDEARHESTAGVKDFLAAAKYLVKPAGRICFIHHPSRVAELLTCAADLKLAPLRLRFVHDGAGTEAGMVLLELAKGRTGTLTVLPPLFVRTAGGEWSNEMLRILTEDVDAEWQEDRSCPSRV